MSADDPTHLIDRVRRGDRDASARLMSIVYDELRRLASAYFRGRPRNATLQPTGLVHEAFVKVLERPPVRLQDRAHFLALCATAMRHILADHARRRGAAKRGGGHRRVSIADVATPGGGPGLDIVALDEALRELESLSDRQARVVEYRFFAGMTVAQVAIALGVSSTTVEQDWRLARAWLSARLGGAPG